MRTPTLAIVIALLAKTAFTNEWDSLDAILDSAISEKVWPGCSAAVFIKDKILYKSARGHYTYGVPPPENPNENPSITTNVKKHFYIYNT